MKHDMSLRKLFFNILEVSPAPAIQPGYGPGGATLPGNLIQQPAQQNTSGQPPAQSVMDNPKILQAIQTWKTQNNHLIKLGALTGIFSNPSGPSELFKSITGQVLPPSENQKFLMVISKP